MRCTLVFAMPGQEWWLTLELADGATVGDALDLARRQVEAGRDELPETLPWDGPTGIYGEACARTRRLEDGDRIELYRPLRQDPKEARRRRATERALPRSRPARR